MSDIRRCPTADRLRLEWYANGFVGKTALQTHIRSCLKCQRRLRRMTELAARAVMPEVEA